jgi:hypothetical protein
LREDDTLFLLFDENLDFEKQYKAHYETEDLMAKFFLVIKTL